MFLMMSCNNFLIILEANHLSDIWILNIFSQFVVCFFIDLTKSSTIFNFYDVQVTICFFHVLCFSVTFKFVTTRWQRFHLQS